MSAHIPKTDGPTTYQAPLHHYDSPARVPDQYVVYLEPGHSLENHKQRVNIEGLSDAITFVFDKLYPDKICYNAQLDAGLLAAVRADPGVELVECDMRIYAAADA
ncbi:hypothetical protein Slin14017_G123380 [Septoria linicola]|nr:hypothetical protein Slin14017_G123380 [Septoria linicola]